MSDFWLFFKIGLDHVLDWQAYDHVLFLVVLVAAYSFLSWKRVLILVSLFTLGHTVSLFLASANYITLSSKYIEFLIPITILLTAIYNIVSVQKNINARLGLYLATVFFGSIHGLGFATYFNLINGENDFLPLLEFALGIELAQIIIVLMVLLVSFIFQKLIGMSKRYWLLLVSILVIIRVVFMLIDTWPF